jgi:hypothetical protein
MIAILIFGAMLGTLLGLRSTALALIPAALLLAVGSACYGLISNQSSSMVLISSLGALNTPAVWLCGGCSIQWRTRGIKPSPKLICAAQMAIGQGPRKLPLSEQMPEHMLSLLGQLEEEAEVSAT